MGGCTSKTVGGCIHINFFPCAVWETPEVCPSVLDTACIFDVMRTWNGRLIRKPVVFIEYCVEIFAVVGFCSTYCTELQSVFLTSVSHLRFKMTCRVLGKICMLVTCKSVPQYTKCL